MRTKIYLSALRDIDLLILLNSVGKKDFGKIVRDALYHVARASYKPKLDVSQIKINVPSEIKSTEFDICMTSMQDEDINFLLSHIRKNCIGLFVKNAIRYYLGPILIIQTLFTEEALNIVQSANKVEIIQIGEFTNKPNKKPKKNTRHIKKVQKKEVLPSLNTNEFSEPIMKKPKEVSIPDLVEELLPDIPGTQNIVPESPEPNVETKADDDEFLMMLQNMIG